MLSHGQHALDDGKTKMFIAENQLCIPILLWVNVGSEFEDSLDKSKCTCSQQKKEQVLIKNTQVLVCRKIAKTVKLFQQHTSLNYYI